MANRMPSITLTGADGLIELLKTIPDKQLLPAVNKGMRAVGSKTIRDARKHLKKNHGLDTGQMKKSLGVRKIKTYKREGRVVMYLGTRKGFSIVHPKTKKKHDPFYIAHLVEFGHRIVGTGGMVQGKPFLRPAVDANKNEFNKQMVTKIGDVLKKARAKSGK